MWSDGPLLFLDGEDLEEADFFCRAEDWARCCWEQLPPELQEEYREMGPNEMVREVVHHEDLPLLLRHFGSEKELVRRWAAGAGYKYAELDPERSLVLIPYLVRLLDSQGPQTRSYALRALEVFGELIPESFRPKIREQVRDRKGYVQRAAAQVIYSWGQQDEDGGRH